MSQSELMAPKYVNIFWSKILVHYSNNKGLEELSFIYPSAMMTYFLSQYEQKSVKTEKIVLQFEMFPNTASGHLLVFSFLFKWNKMMNLGDVDVEH